MVLHAAALNSRSFGKPLSSNALRILLFSSAYSQPTFSTDLSKIPNDDESSFVDAGKPPVNPSADSTLESTQIKIFIQEYD
jgi:hypothetical protein